MRLDDVEFSRRDCARLNRTTPQESSTSAATLLVLALLSLAMVAARAAGPLSAATVTKLENKVKYGEVRGKESVTRVAAVSDVVRERNFVLTETDSRAELQYEDGSVVRVGQNTVFSFEANSRTLTLKEGTFIFYVPKGQGGGMIKTPSLTAAITGTLGKVSTTTIAILEGEVTLVPSGRKVRAGEFARRMADGRIIIARFDPVKAGDGVLMAFNGPMPGFIEDQLLPGGRLALAMPDLSHFDALERTQNGPSAIQLFNPPANLTRTRIVVPRPPNEPPVKPPY
jgi:hypothetical protein